MILRGRIREVRVQIVVKSIDLIVLGHIRRACDSPISQGRLQERSSDQEET